MLNKTLDLPIHHIGVACKNLEKEREIFLSWAFAKKGGILKLNLIKRNSRN